MIFNIEFKRVQQKGGIASDAVKEIPQCGSKHSLNISLSYGVLIWDKFSKLKSNNSS